MRAVLRLQQDEALKSLGISIETDEPAEASEGEPQETANDAATPLLVRPMIEATRAYSRVGRAFIVAIQRDTFFHSE